MNYFEELNAVNVSDKIETKEAKGKKLSYLSWAYAWAELKKRHPLANYKVYERDGINYFTDGRTCWVKVSVIVPTYKTGDINDPIGCIEHVEMLPVLDYRNDAIPLERVTSYDVNKSIQRALTKAVARHGLGLYIYAGEDLPEEEKATPKPKKDNRPTIEPPPQKQTCLNCGKEITAAGGMTAEQLAKARFEKYGMPLCDHCAAVKRNIMKNAAEATK